MSTGKRLAKRSILGTRVACWLEDGRYYPGVICDVKNMQECPSYTVRIEGERRTREFKENDIVGSGFTPVNSVKLKAGQKVFITFNQREVQGVVVYHRPNIDEVMVTVENPENGIKLDVQKRLEEIRLLESRKSPRLADQDTDFAKLADCVSDRGTTRKISSTIDVPNILQPGCSRKRRNSPSEDDQTDECAAALVLMKLSCSPRSPALHEAMMPLENFSVGSSASSGVWSMNGSWNKGTRSVTPSPPLSDSTSADDGIDFDEIHEENIPRKRRSSTRTMFRCTWKECNEIAQSAHKIEQHIRSVHLGRRIVSSDSEYDSEDDREEEFYWTEFEVNVATYVEPPKIQTSQSPLPKDLLVKKPIIPLSPQWKKIPVPLVAKPTLSPSMEGQQMQTYTFVSAQPTFSHMDMARPPHEDHEYFNLRTGSPSVLSSSWPRSSYMHGPGKIKARTTNSSVKVSGRGKRNGETRKCRKVYGMEQKDQWCTQCKWKKACSRFSE